MRWLFAPPKKADPHANAMRDRAALLKRERALTREIERLYKVAKKNLTPELQALTAKIAEARKLGLAIGASWLENEARLSALLLQIEAQITAFARASATATEKAQRVSIERGSIDAIGAFREAARYAGINAAFERLPVEALQHLAGTLADGTPLAAWFDAIGPKARQAASETLFTGLAQGLGSKDIARNLREAVDISKTSAMLTARQASIGAYRAAAQQEYAANSDVVTGWRWTCSYSVRTCAMCIAMDGTKHAVTEKLISHLACVVGDAAVFGPALRAGLRRWFEGEVIDIRTEGGHVLTVTPNHPVLTPKGWIAAGLLAEGGDIVCCTFGEGVLPVVDPDNDDGPSAAEDVFETLCRAGRMGSMSMPTTAKDFHGDGIGAGEVEIVPANRLLWDCGHVAAMEPMLNPSLVGRAVGAIGLSGSGHLLSRFLGKNHALRRPMSSLAIAAIFLRRALGYHQAIGLGVIADRDTGSLEPNPDHVAGRCEGLSDGVFGLAGFVTAGNVRNGKRVHGQSGSGRVLSNQRMARFRRAQGDSPGGEDQPQALSAYAEGLHEVLNAFSANVAVSKVVEIGRRQICSHVYNFETQNGWYAADGVIVHNCRCTETPILAGGEEQPRTTGPEWFEKQDAATQDTILGPLKGRLYRGGDISLADLVKQGRDATWGDWRAEKSIRDLVREGSLSNATVAEAAKAAR